MRKTFAFLTAAAFAMSLVVPAFAQTGSAAGGTDKPAATSESSNPTKAGSEATQ